MLRLPPQHKAHATSCSHSNAICNHRFKKRIELRTQEQPLAAKHIGGTIRDRNDRSRNRRTDEVPFIAGCGHFTRKNTRFRAPASSPTQSPCNIMQQFQCDLPPQLQETHRTTHTGTTTRCKTHRRNNSRQKRPQPQPPHRRGIPFIAGCSHFTLKNTRFRAPASSPTQSPCNIMQPFQCDLQPQLQETHRTTHTGATTRCKTHRRNNSRQKRPQPQPPHRRGTFHRRLQSLYTEKHKVSCSGFPTQSPCNIMQPFQCDLPPQLQETHRTTHTGTTPRCKTHRRNNSRQKRPQPQPPHRRGTFHRRLQRLYTEKTHGFVLRLPPQLTTSLRHHSPSSSLTSLRHHFPSSPLPFVTTSLHHFPSSPFPFVTTPLHHHFPVSPLPFVTTSLLHHFPSSPLSFVTTPLLHHFPSSPLPFVTTSLPHHFPSSPLPFLTTPLHHHFPSSPLPFLTTSLPHHSPSSPLPFLTTSLPHHFPSSPLLFVTTLCLSFLFFCCVLLDNVLFCDLPHFIIVNCIK